MWTWLAIKALVSGIIVAAVSEIARRYPTTGALVASLPLVSVLGLSFHSHSMPSTDTKGSEATNAPVVG